jgi:hypothetical protein
MGAVLPYGNATKIFLPIFYFEKNISFFKILINLRTYITYNESIDSFNVLHKPFYWDMSVILLLDIGLFFFQYPVVLSVCGGRGLEEGVTYSQVSALIILCVSRHGTCFVLRNYKFMKMFSWHK